MYVDGQHRMAPIAITGCGGELSRHALPELLVWGAAREAAEGSERMAPERSKLDGVAAPPQAAEPVAAPLTNAGKENAAQQIAE